MKISVKGIVTSVALKRKVTRDDEYDVLAFKIEIARDRSQYTNLADLTRARKNKGELT